MLFIAAFLLIFIALVHSILGEKYILIRLFRRNNLPKLFGGTWFTENTLRFAWHVTSFAWVGFAAVLVTYEMNLSNPEQKILLVTFATFFLTGLVAFVFSKGKHLSWIVFWAIAAICGWAALY